MTGRSMLSLLFLQEIQLGVKTFASSRKFHYESRYFNISRLI